jgi:acyl-coenzyme A synthetase/AMP-(fatty) acid ligase
LFLYPRLEALLLTNELVADCAVIGIPDLVGSAGELVKAYVVLKSPTPDPAKTVKEIQDFVAKKVAHYKRLTGGVEFVESVPKSASGKILRRILRDHEKAKTAVKAKL